MALITNTNTNTGATAFSAPTNRLPNRPTAKPAAGETHANKIPSTKPTTICLTRLTRPSAPRIGFPPAMMIPLNMLRKDNIVK